MTFPVFRQEEVGMVDGFKLTKAQKNEFTRCRGRLLEQIQKSKETIEHLQRSNALTRC